VLLNVAAFAAPCSGTLLLGYDGKSTLNIRRNSLLCFYPLVDLHWVTELEIIRTNMSGPYLKRYFRGLFLRWMTINEILYRKHWIKQDPYLSTCDEYEKRPG